MSKLWADRSNNDPLWLRPLNNEAADHHVVASLDECTRADISQRRLSNASCGHSDNTDTGIAHETNDD